MAASPQAEGMLDGAHFPFPAFYFLFFVSCELYSLVSVLFSVRGLVVVSNVFPINIIKKLPQDLI